jgi:hypothetical protein
MERHLIALYDAGGAVKYVHTPSLPHSGNDLAFAVIWNLIKPQTDAEGRHRAGWWKLTRLGVRFVQGRARLEHRHADVFLGRVVRMYGPPWSIRQALGKRFDLDALLDGNGSE